MSATPQGPGWWQASDGNWYPPEQAPGAQPTPTPPTPTPTPGPSGGPSSNPSYGSPAGSSFPATTKRKTPTPAEIVIMAGGGVVLIFSFLAFYSAPFGDASLNAWDTGLFPVATLTVLFAVAAAVLVALGVFGVNVPDKIASFSRTQILLVCGAFATLQSLAYLLVDHLSADLGVGFWLMLLGSIAVLVGAIMMFREAPATR